MPRPLASTSFACPWYATCEPRCQHVYCTSRRNWKITSLWRCLPVTGHVAEQYGVEILGRGVRGERRETDRAGLARAAAQHGCELRRRRELGGNGDEEPVGPAELRCGKLLYEADDVLLGDVFHWCAQRNIRQLNQLNPTIVAAYVEELSKTHAKPSVKQHLAAVRMLFDWLSSSVR